MQANVSLIWNRSFRQEANAGSIPGDPRAEICRSVKNSKGSESRSLCYAHTVKELRAFVFVGVGLAYSALCQESQPERRVTVPQQTRYHILSNVNARFQGGRKAKVFCAGSVRFYFA
jgi:hypothetical protein